jgi:transposase
VAKELGLAYNTLHRWVKEYKESNGKSFVGSGNIKPQNQEIVELRRRNQEQERVHLSESISYAERSETSHF